MSLMELLRIVLIVMTILVLVGHGGYYFATPAPGGTVWYRGLNLMASILLILFLLDLMNVIHIHGR
jgi:hypothetical protein